MQAREVPGVLGRQEILDKVEAHVLDPPQEVAGLARIEPFVHVVQQLDVVADQFTHPGEDPRDGPHIRGRVPRDAPGPYGLRINGRSPGSVGVRARHGGLDADVPESAFPCGGDLVGDLPLVGAVDVCVGLGAGAHAAAEQRVQGRPEALGLQVPQGDVDAAEGVAGDRTAAPVGAVEEQPVDVLDVVGVPSGEHRGEVVVEDRADGKGRCGSLAQPSP